MYGNYFQNCYIVKRILISFNCFSEYICGIVEMRHNTITYQQVVNVKQDIFSLDVFEADVDLIYLTR